MYKNFKMPLIRLKEKQTKVVLQKKELIFFPFASCCLLYLQHYRSMEFDCELSSKPWKFSKTLQKVNVLILLYILVFLQFQYGWEKTQF